MTAAQIFKKDSKGKTRVWSQEQDGARYRTIAGIYGGNLVESEWTVCIGKQGRTDVEQATFEVAANYKNKLTREYHDSIEAIEDGAHFFKPMLAQEYKGFPGSCFAQPKLDGARCIATKDGLFSRQGKPFVSVPHIAQALAPLFESNPDAILDGELYNHDLKDDFGQIMSLVRQQKPTPEELQASRDLAQYHVYDMPSTNAKFALRSEIVNRAVSICGSPYIVEVATRPITTQEELDEFHAEQISRGYEGSMVRLNQPYEQKRSKSLLKRKEFLTKEFPIVSIEEGLGNWSGVAKSVTLKLLDGRTFGAGIRGTKERAAQLLHETHEEATVRFFEYTPDGVPRFPVVIDFHQKKRID